MSCLGQAHGHKACTLSLCWVPSTHGEFCPRHCPVALPQVIFETFAWDLSNSQDGRYPPKMARPQGTSKMLLCCNPVTLPSWGLFFPSLS